MHVMHTNEYKLPVTLSVVKDQYKSKLFVKYNLLMLPNVESEESFYSDHPNVASLKFPWKVLTVSKKKIITNRCEKLQTLNFK